MAEIPQPLQVEMVAPPPESPGPPRFDWSAPTSQLRDVAKWIVGGVVATAAGVFAGSTLTKLGAMSFPDDAQRLGLALVGAAVGFLAIAAIMESALKVLAPAGHNLRLLAEAPDGSADAKARDLLYSLTGIRQDTYKLDDLLDEDQSAAGKFYLPMLYPAAPFCVVRICFDRLLGRMRIAVPLAILGFGLFAWAANPPDPPARPSRPGIEIKITT
jgi:hypothetical protein